MGLMGPLLDDYVNGAAVYETEITPPMGMSKGVSVALVTLKMGARDGSTLVCLAVADYADARLLGVLRDQTGLKLAVAKINAVVKKLDPLSVRVLAPGEAAESSAEGAESTPADWYADPKGTARLRYWDGSQWTDHVAD